MAKTSAANKKKGSKLTTKTAQPRKTTANVKSTPAVRRQAKQLLTPTSQPAAESADSSNALRVTRSRPVFRPPLPPTTDQQADTAPPSSAPLIVESPDTPTTANSQSAYDSSVRPSPVDGENRGSQPTSTPGSALCSARTSIPPPVTHQLPPRSVSDEITTLQRENARLRGECIRCLLGPKVAI